MVTQACIEFFMITVLERPLPSRMTACDRKYQGAVLGQDTDVSHGFAFMRKVSQNLDVVSLLVHKATARHVMGRLPGLDGVS